MSQRSVPTTVVYDPDIQDSFLELTISTNHEISDMFLESLVTCLLEYGCFGVVRQDNSSFALKFLLSVVRESGITSYELLYIIQSTMFYLYKPAN